MRQELLNQVWVLVAFSRSAGQPETDGDHVASISAGVDQDILDRSMNSVPVFLDAAFDMEMIGWPALTRGDDRSIQLRQHRFR